MPRRLEGEEKRGRLPGADVIASSKPECVAHGWTQLCQFAVLLAPKEALSETAVSLSLEEHTLFI